MRTFASPRLAAISAASALLLLPVITAKATTAPHVIYSFKGGTADGANPNSGLVEDASGNIWGTTVAGGTANSGALFKLTPPAAGKTAYTETIPFVFGKTPSTLKGPVQGLLSDKVGNLFGATSAGGRYNTGGVFECTASGATVNCNDIYDNPKTSGSIVGFALNSTTNGTDTIGVVTKGASPTPLSQLVSLTLVGKSWVATRVDSLAAGMSFKSTIPYNAGFLSITTPGTSDQGEAIMSIPPAAGSSRWTNKKSASFGVPFWAGYPAGLPVVASTGKVYVSAELVGPSDSGALDQLAPSSLGTSFKVTEACIMPSYGRGIADGIKADGGGNDYVVLANSTVPTSYLLMKETPPLTTKQTCVQNVIYNFGAVSIPKIGLISGNNVLVVTTDGNGAIEKFSGVASLVASPDRTSVQNQTGANRGAERIQLSH